MELAKSFEPHAIEAKWYPLWESRGYFKPTLRARRAAVLHPAAAAERHRHAAHGACVPADADGRADPLPPDARRQHAVAARHRPRRHRHADRRRAAAEGAGRVARTISAARNSSSASGRGRRSPARRSRTRCDGSARRATGRASASRWTQGLSAAVLETFVRLFEDGLIYRGKRLVNWDPTLGTAVSDLEVENEEEQGKIWEIRYPGAAGGDATSSSPRRGPRRCWATSRSRSIPTTSAMRRSSARRSTLPLTGRTIPVIADAYVDKAFGTGCVKITPAHDFNDWQVGAAPRPRADSDPQSRRDDQRQRAGEVSRPRSLRGAQGGARRPRGAGPRRQREGAPDGRAALRPHRRSRRADADGPVVRRDEDAGAGDASVFSRAARSRTSASPPSATASPSPQRRRARSRPVRAGAVAVDVPALDQQHPGLVHLAPAVVGPPDSGVVRRRRQRLRRAQRGRRARAGRREARARAGDVHAGRGRARHVVLVGAVVPLDARLAGGHARARDVPAVVGARHRLRHHLLLGRADDHDDDLFHRQGAVPRRLHQRHRARRGRPEDVEVEGQRARPDRPDRRRRRSTCSSRSARRTCWIRGRRSRSRSARESSSRTAFRASAPTRCASRSRASPPTAARSTSTSPAATATATSATSCGTRRDSC